MSREFFELYAFHFSPLGERDGLTEWQRFLHGKDPQCLREAVEALASRTREDGSAYRRKPSPSEIKRAYYEAMEAKYRGTTAKENCDACDNSGFVMTLWLPDSESERSREGWPLPVDALRGFFRANVRMGISCALCTCSHGASMAAKTKVRASFLYRAAVAGRSFGSAIGGEADNLAKEFRAVCEWLGDPDGPERNRGYWDARDALAAHVEEILGHACHDERLAAVAKRLQVLCASNAAQ